MNKLNALISTRLGVLTTDNRDMNETKKKLEELLKKLEAKIIDPETLEKFNREKAAMENELNQVLERTKALKAQLDSLDLDKRVLQDEKNLLDREKSDKLRELDRLHQEKSNLQISPVKSVKKSTPRAESPQPVKLKAKKNDEVDDHVTRFMNEHDLKVRFEWVSVGK